MLVLSRQVDEAIIIEGGIKITIVDIRGKHVRLGIDAPVSIGVFREEIAEAIRAEGRELESLALKALRPCPDDVEEGEEIDEGVSEIEI